MMCAVVYYCLTPLSAGASRGDFFKPIAGYFHSITGEARSEAGGLAADTHAHNGMTGKTMRLLAKVALCSEHGQ